MTHSIRKILVTSALPYANGPIHLGHLVEYIQTDIWVRFQRMCGHECLYVCADDTHGTPIMLRAQAENVSPEQLIERIWQEHRADFDAFSISFDNYYTTHSEENRLLSEEIYRRLIQAGHITRRSIKQAYDPVKEMFLPDRFIRGTCPRCGARDQYGDNCEVCGATYAPTDLKDAVSTLSGVQPIERDSEHFFFTLGNFEEFLRNWLYTPDARRPVQEGVANKLEEWFSAGLKDWDISRDAPYFGFEIPGETGKFFYVWLDAPIGYMASLENLCTRTGCDFAAYWNQESTAEVYHFIGKDILYFHTLFWPAILEGAGYRKPTAVFAHGFLTLNGEKMSKSRGTFITARRYLDHLNPDYLRYYFAAKLTDSIEDIDLNFEDYLSRINSNLVGKYINIASRSAPFIEKRFAGKLSDVSGEAMLQEMQAASSTIAACYEQRHYAEAVRLLMNFADRANQYIDAMKPWVLAKNTDADADLQWVCSVGVNAFRLLTLYLKPILPMLAEQAEVFLNVKPLTWDDAQHLLDTHTIHPYHHLAKRVEQAQIQAVVEQAPLSLTDSSSSPSSPAEVAGTNTSTMEPLRPLISYEDFAKLDLRVARIVMAENVEGAEKLLRLTLDIGGETRNVFAGIKDAYQPETLIGRYTVMIANLAPRKMRFGISEGMVLAAGPGKRDLWILSPDAGAQAGMRVK